MNYTPNLFPDTKLNFTPDLFPEQEPSVSPFQRFVEKRGQDYPAQTLEKPVISPIELDREMRKEIPIAKRIGIAQLGLLSLLTPTGRKMFATGFQIGMEGWRRASEAIKAPLYEYQRAVLEGKPRTKPVTQAFTDALKGLRITPGREIVKNMGLPLDDPDWQVKNPAKHFVSEMLGAWYETYGTDPIIMASWAKSVPYARKAALFQKLVKETGKKFTPAIIDASKIPISSKLATKISKDLSGGFWNRQAQIAGGLKKVSESELKQAIKAIRNAKAISKPPITKPLLPPTGAIVPTEPIRPAVPTPPVKAPIVPIKPVAPIKPEVTPTKAPVKGGKITVYHRTDTPIGDIKKTGFKTSENTDEVFLSSTKNGQAVGYGKNVIELKIDTKDLRLDDEFPSGEQHFAVKKSIIDKVFQEAQTPTPSPLVEEAKKYKSVEEFVEREGRLTSDIKINKLNELIDNKLTKADKLIEKIRLDKFHKRIEKTTLEKMDKEIDLLYEEMENLKLVKKDLLAQKYYSLLRNKRKLDIGLCEGTCVSRTDIPLEQAKAFNITNKIDFAFFARKINKLEKETIDWGSIEINDSFLIATESGIERLYPIKNAIQFIKKSIEVYSKSQLKAIYTKAHPAGKVDTKELDTTNYKYLWMGEELSNIKKIPRTIGGYDIEADLKSGIRPRANYKLSGLKKVPIGEDITKYKKEAKLKAKELITPTKTPAEVVKQAQPEIKPISAPETPKQIEVNNKLNQQADDEIVKMYSGIPFTDKEIDWSKAKGLGTKIAKMVSVEYPFRQIGAKETGLAIKTYASKAEAGQEFTKNTIIKLGDKYKLNKSDWNELPFARELPEQFKKLPAEQQAKLKPALDEIDKIFTKYKKEGTERKYWDTGFPESRIRSLEDEAKSLIMKARKTKNIIAKQQYANRIAENYKAIDFLKHSGIKYVHLPVKLWLSKLADTNPQLYTKVFSTKPKALYGRKTLKIQDLIDSKLIKKEDVDMRDILSNYMEYMERVKASDDIVISAVKEGLAVFGAKEGYRTFPAYMFPEFSKHSFHPVFAEWLESTYTPFKKPSDINKIMAYAKLFTFTNPTFMGLTNAHQGVVAVGLKGMYPKTIRNAFKLLANKPTEYFQAQKEGISSKPFRSPYEDFRKDIEYIKKKQDSTLPRIVFSAIQLLGKFTKNPIMTVYQTQWNLTWQYFDRIPRFITYSALRNEGWSIRDSAQLAAKYHGDYAGVPIKTRQMLNKLLYTPTYRIAMTKLQIELVASIFKNTRPEVIKMLPRKTPDGIVYTRQSAWRRKALSSLAILAGTLLGIDYAYRKQGWKREQFARRYYREVDTPEGKREIVTTLALPQNVMLRTMFRAGNISGVNPLLSSIRGFKWDLHPIWRVMALDIIATNRGSDGEPIYDPNALKNPNKAPKELIKIGWYATKEIVKMIGIFNQSEESTKRKKEAHGYAKRDLNKIFYYILRPNMFAYLRKTKEEKKDIEAYILKKETVAKMRRLTDEKEIDEWADNLEEQINKILGY